MNSIQISNKQNARLNTRIIFRLFEDNILNLHTSGSAEAC